MNNRIIVDIEDVGSNISELVRQIESGPCEGVVIARQGTPVARLLPIANSGIKLGVAGGTYPLPENIDVLNRLIEETFTPA